MSTFALRSLVACPRPKARNESCEGTKAAGQRRIMPQAVKSLHRRGVHNPESSRYWKAQGMADKPLDWLQRYAQRYGTPIGEAGLSFVMWRSERGFACAVWRYDGDKEHIEDDVIVVSRVLVTVPEADTFPLQCLLLDSVDNFLKYEASEEDS